MKKQRLFGATAVALLLLLSACGPTSPVSQLLAPTSPRDRYERSLRRAQLLETPTGQAWLAAGERALRDSLTVTLPFRETGQFTDSLPAALSYRFRLPAGRRLVARVEQPATDSVRYFLDLFELDRSGREPKRLTFAESGEASLRHAAPDTATLLVRLQPPLDSGAQFTLTLESRPVLDFPVAGKNSTDILSFWGMPRDGGRRRHEGIDVAASRGTPVVAAADGFVTNVGENPLGGLVVSQSVPGQGLSLYYAHLDRQLVSIGQRVRTGDTLGTVGNTGNARTTIPHLHFGIYSGYRQPVDPLPYVDTRGTQPPAITAATRRLGDWVRVTARQVPLRQSPETSGAVVQTLDRNTLAHVRAATRNQYRVELPDGTAGYVAATQVQALTGRVRKQRLAAPASLLSQPPVRADLPADSLTQLPANASVDVLGRFGDFEYVETGQGQRGWLRLTP
jgi:murein DD-endopeptidase MepM/ murein hydrolase activator NlpD